MPLKKRSLTADWVDVDEPIDGRVLLRPETGDVAAEFTKRAGLRPTSQVDAGSGESTVRIAFDPEKMRAAQVWWLCAQIENLEGKYDDGTKYSWPDKRREREAIAKNIIDDGGFDMLQVKARELYNGRVEELEKN